MKILILTHAISRHKDDHPQFINELALAYQKAGHDVKVLTASHYSIEKTELDERLSFEFYRYAPKSMEVLGYGESLHADKSLRISAILLAPFLFLSGVLKLRRLIRTFRPDFVHAHWALPNGPIAALGAIGLKTPYVISFPGSDVTSMAAHPVLTSLGRLVCNHAVLLTTNSNDLRNKVISMGVKEKNFELVLYGSDEAVAPENLDKIKTLRDKFGIKPAEKVILAVGRLIPKKGFRYLIEAIPEVNRIRGSKHDYKVLIIGEGVERKEFEQLIAEQGLEDQVIMVGTVAYNDLSHYYRMADIFAMPAVREPEDGLNVVVTEAMKYSLPVACTNVGGNELVVVDGENGYCCVEKNAFEFAMLLVKLLNNETEARQMGADSYKKFIDIASWEKIVARYCSLVAQRTHV
jgi:glycosyltransferase involved in cell wall biosynthesis